MTADCDSSAGPEYNGFPTPLFVNSVAWASRGDPKGEMGSTFKAKTAAIISTSPGGLGGMRSLGAYKELLQNLGVTCLPLSVAVGGSFKAFTEDGSLVAGQLADMLDALITQLYEVARDGANRDVACEILGALKRAQTAGEYGSIPGQKPTVV
jgi:NAD(P)H-dependent FMN reductase